MYGNVNMWIGTMLLIVMHRVMVSASDIDTFVYTRKYDPPRIFPNPKEVTITVENNYTLRCEGNFPVFWKYPHEDFENCMQTQSHTPDVDYPYGTILDIYYIEPENVGYYTCLFNKSSDSKDLKGYATKIYIYVEDPKVLLVPLENSYVGGAQHSSVTFPCRPTAPNVLVDLQLNQGTMTELITNNSIYDPHIGFTHIAEAIGFYLYSCIAKRENETKKINIHAFIHASTALAPKPSINDSSHGKAMIGGEINLDCIVYEDNGLTFTMDWITPATDPSRIIPTVSKIENINMQRMGKTSLKIKNVTREDEGEYKCQIIDVNKNFNEDTKTITVFEKGMSYLNLTEPAGINETTLNVGKYVTWVVKIYAFPEPQITWFDNHNKLIPAGWSDTRSAKYKINTTFSKTSLVINNLTLEDAGIYTLKAENLYNLTKSLNLKLLVKGGPNIYFEPKKYYLNGTRSSIECIVEGYPLPKVKWYFQSCINDIQCQESFAQEIPEQFYNTTKTLEYKESSILTLNINQSGKLSCSAEAENKKPVNVTSLFHVSDIENGFGIIQDNTIVADGDNFILICAASIFSDFTGIMEWHKLSKSAPVKIVNDTEKGYSVIRRTTDFSHHLILSIPNINNSYNGEYECVAKKNGKEPARQRLSLNVIDVEKPHIIQSNMNNSYYKLQEGQTNVNFHCKANGIPIPVIKWFKNGEEIKKGDDRIKIADRGSKLEIAYIKENDGGKFECKAISRVGSDSRYMDISVPTKLGYIITINVLAIIFFILIIILIWKIRREQQILKELSIAGLAHFVEGATECINPELGIDEQAELLPYDKKWEFPREKLKLGKQLGSGAFGVVLKAVAYGIIIEEESTVVAVKMVKKTADATFIKALASELKIMVHLGQHLNVVNLLGACTKNVSKRELSVIVEYCRFGNLHNYLLRHRGSFIDQIDHSTDIIDHTIGSYMINRAYSISSNKSCVSFTDSLISGPHSSTLDTANTLISMLPNGEMDGVVVSNGSIQPEWRSNYRGDYNYNRDVRPISTQDLICWSFQVARGMEYLANRKVLHGDLAARNILLADDNIVKICDFGLAKSMYKDDNYKKKGNGPLPVKWMAIESITDRVFSTQSDVWSYGIVLWELFSLASTPYPGMEADENLYHRLVKGYRMKKPQYSNEQIYQIMMQCWRSQPVQRPTFTELAESFGSLLEDNIRKHFVDLNNPYVDMNNKWMTERGDNDYLAMMISPDYGNLVSANDKHEYVNDPCGGPTSVNPQSPDSTGGDGYLCMSPVRNSETSKSIQVFNFPSSTNNKKKVKSLRECDEVDQMELMPMLSIDDNKPQSIKSDSDLGESNSVTQKNEPISLIQPDTTKNFSNPSYKLLLNIENIDKLNKNDLLITKDNYVKMSQKDSGFYDSPDNNIPTNHNYVIMSGNPNPSRHTYNNLPTSLVI